MAKDGKIKIDIEVDGDPSGAEDVAKGLEKVGKGADAAAKKGKDLSGELDQFDKSAKKSADSGKKLDKFTKDLFAKPKARIAAARAELAKLDRKGRDLFPTFKRAGGGIKKLGGDIKELGGPLAELTDKANLIGGAVLGGIGVATAAFVGFYQKAVSGEKEFLAVAGKGFEKLDIEVGEFVPTSDALTESLDRQADAIATVEKNLAAAESGIRRATTDQDALADSTDALTIARLRLSEANGEITAEQAEQKIAVVNATSAEEAYRRQLQAAEQILAKRIQAQAEIAEKTRLANQAVAEAEAIAGGKGSGNLRDKANRIDPEFNRAIDDARRRKQRGTVGSAESLGEDINGVLGDFQETSFTDKIVAVRAITKLVQGYKDRKKAQEEAAEAEREASEDLEAAITARSEAVRQAAADSTERIQRLRQAAAQAAEKAADAAAKVTESRGDVASRRGGVQRQVFENQKRTEEIRSRAARAQTPTAAAGGREGPASTPAPSGIDTTRIEAAADNAFADFLAKERENQEKLARLEQKFDSVTATLARADARQKQFRAPNKR